MLRSRAPACLLCLHCTLRRRITRKLAEALAGLESPHPARGKARGRGRGRGGGRGGSRSRSGSRQRGGESEEDGGADAGLNDEEEDEDAPAGGGGPAPMLLDDGGAAEEDDEEEEEGGDGAEGDEGAGDDGRDVTVATVVRPSLPFRGPFHFTTQRQRPRRRLLLSPRLTQHNLKTAHNQQDSFQGMEKEVIVLSLCGPRAGFSTRERINVALTRGRRHLVCLGRAAGANAQSLAKEDWWQGACAGGRAASYQGLILLHFSHPSARKSISQSPSPSRLCPAADLFRCVPYLFLSCPARVHATAALLKATRCGARNAYRPVDHPGHLQDWLQRISAEAGAPPAPPAATAAAAQAGGGAGLLSPAVSGAPWGGAGAGQQPAVPASGASPALTPGKAPEAAAADGSFNDSGGFGSGCGGEASPWGKENARQDPSSGAPLAGAGAASPWGAQQLQRQPQEPGAGYPTIGAAGGLSPSRLFGGAACQQQQRQAPPPLSPRQEQPRPALQWGGGGGRWATGAGAGGGGCATVGGDGNALGMHGKTPNSNAAGEEEEDAGGGPQDYYS